MIWFYGRDFQTQIRLIENVEFLKPVSSTFASVELLSEPLDLKASEALCIHPPVHQVLNAQLRDNLMRERCLQ